LIVSIVSHLSTVALVILGVGVVAVVRRIWVEVRRLLGRHAAARAAHKQQQLWHREFLYALTDLVRKDTSRSKSLRAICRRLGWSEGHALLVMDYLADKTLVERTSLWAASDEEWVQALGKWISPIQVKLTARGFDEAERAQLGPPEHVPSILAHDGSIVNFNSPHSAIRSPAASIQSPGSAVRSPGSTLHLVQHAPNPTDLADWIRMYREALHQPASLSAHRVRWAGSLLDQLEHAVDDGDLTRIEGLGRTLRAIAEGVAGNAAFAAILAAARAFSFGS